jgi:hypothetical protein
MIEYKGFKVENLNKDYIVYFSGNLGDNRIFDNLEDLRVYIDNRLLLEEKNKRFMDNQKAEELKQIELKKEEEKYLNLFLNTLKEGIQKEKIKHFLLSPIKKRFNVVGFDYYTKNYKQIENLNKVGRIALNEECLNKSSIEKMQYIAKNKEGAYFILKKTEYLYLKFLNGLNNEVLKC